jgi:S1-C subfamily serine protease
MEQFQLTELVEKYLRGEMNQQEKDSFDELRRANAELDQAVVEYAAFFEQVEKYGSIRRFKSTIYDIHENLQEDGSIGELKIKASAKIINLWTRYRRVIAVAASIASITALFISGMITLFSPKAPLNDIEELRRKVSSLERQTTSQRAELTKFRNKIEPGVSVKFGGTSFMVDPKGYLITSAHVIKDAKKVYVQNNAGENFLAEIIHTDPSSDLCILKINDPDFKAPKALPYGFKKTSTELSESLFTLGYPKDEIVYNEGYLSAMTGMNGDTLACQITISANPGNSGGPVINKNGEVIGILNARQASANGVVFATKSINIFNMMRSVREIDADNNVQINQRSSIKGLSRSQQVKKIQDHVYMVKVVLG